MNEQSIASALESVPESIRSDPEFLAVHKTREERARLARVAQSAYRARQVRVVWATTLAAVVGGLLLYGFDPPDLPKEPPPTQSELLRNWLARDWVRTVLGLLQALALAAVAWSAHLVRRARYDEAWLEHRLAAEDGRVKRALVALQIGHRVGPEEVVPISRTVWRLCYA